MNGRILLAGLAMAVLATACSGGDATPTPSTGGASSTTAEGSTTTVAPPTTAVTSTAGVTAGAFTLESHLFWLVDLLEGAPLDEAGYASRFDDGFRGQVPFGAFTPVLDQFAGEWEIVRFDEATDGLSGRALIVEAGGNQFNVDLVMSDGADGRLSGLLLSPAALANPPATLEDLERRFRADVPMASLLIADVTDGCPPDAPEQRLPVGSAFKLWVLGALAIAVEAGEVGWDDPVVVRDDLKSLPSGVLQLEPAGTEVTVLDAAELMIAISDNTATDHLIDLVGRRAVEEAMVVMGHGDPALNRPFPLTTELFHLKVVLDDEARTTYLDGDEDARRAFLDGLTVDLSGIDLSVFTTGQTFQAGELEWFGSVGDLCRALVWLWLAAEHPGLDRLLDVLGANPGASIDTAQWPQLGFKGGSEPGVLSLSWIARRADGSVFVVSGIQFDPDGPLAEIPAALLLEHAFRLLAAEA